MIPIDRIQPATTPGNPEKRDRLIESMRAIGWSGRPLLVVAVQINEKYHALTGSHRYDAAAKVPLKEIPCCIIDNQRWRRSGLQFESILHLQERDRVQDLRRGGLHDAADLCQQEIEASSG